MSKKEAELFKKFVKLTMCDPDRFYRFTGGDRRILEKYGLKFTDISLLVEMGLVQIGAARYIIPGENFYILNDSEVINIINNSNKNKPLNVIVTTASGTELANIITELDNSINKEFIEDFIKELNKNNEFTIKSGKYYKIENNEVHWVSED